MPKVSMDSIFLLAPKDRADFLRQMMQSFVCTHICIWSHLTDSSSNCLLSLDSVYRETGASSSSSGSFAEQLFNVYRESVNRVDAGRIPGFAVKNNLSYMELKLHDLPRMASSQLQLQFYKEAGVKTVVFMGCPYGEIELGLSNDIQVDLETQLKAFLLLSDFSPQPPQMNLPIQPSDRIQRPSSSSSSLRSLSVDSTEYPYSPKLYNLPLAPTTFLSNEVVAPISISNQMRGIQFPAIDIVDAAMTDAILAVLSSSPSSSPTSQQTGETKIESAFRRYQGDVATTGGVTQKHSMFKRSVLYFRNLNLRKRKELRIQSPTTPQLRHMINERRRREKLNESFQSLRSMLPQGAKKDKASLLGSVTDHLSSLISQVEDLRRTNQDLESQLSFRTSEAREVQKWGSSSSSSSSTERITVEISEVSSSTREARFLDLRVTVRGECSMLDLVIRILHFLKQQSIFSLLSVESSSRMLETTPVHGITLRVKIKVDEFDESGFQEAVRRVVEDQS